VAHASAGAGLQPSSTARALSVLRSFFRFLARHHGLNNGVVTTLRTPRVPHSIPKALSEQEARDAIQGARDQINTPWIGKRDLALTMLLYGCGFRISEALLLNRGDVPVMKGDDIGTLTITGKGNKQRIVPLLPAVAESISEYLAVCPIEGSPDEPLFSRSNRGRGSA
jgi:integrase/recombinase XerC